MSTGGFNTTGTLPTTGRNRFSVSLGRTRRASASITRIFNFCNRNNQGLDYAFNCTFNSSITPTPSSPPIPTPPIPVNTFTYTFYNSSGITNLTPYIPIYAPDSQISFTYNSYIIGANNLTRVDVSWTFTDNGSTGSGLSFYGKTNFYNTLANRNINILQFANIPLSRASSTGNGNQFEDLDYLTISASDTPTILSNTKFSYIFNSFTNQSIFNSNINGWNTSNVITFESTFNGCTQYNQPISNWITSSATSMAFMFQNCIAFNQSVSNFNTSNVTSMAFMFQNCNNFNQSVSNFNTNNVNDMSGMFTRCYNFNQSVSNFNTSNVTNFYYMFSECYSFNQPLNNFNTINVVNMQSMFANAFSFNQDLSSWNVSNVGVGPNGAPSFAGMFLGASSFNNGDLAAASNKPLTGWNTSNVINMNQMFNGASSFNQSISGWNTSKLQYIYQMFNNAVSFNNGQPAGGTTNPLNWTSIALLTNYGSWHNNSPLTQTNATPLNVAPYW